jgi:mannose-1-phosphate guanylyltransferase
MFAGQQPDAVMAVMPSDHVITTTPQFQAAIRYAVAIVQQDPQQLVTFGVRPTYPAESFGYIERADRIVQSSEIAAFRVARFHEKPNTEIAAQYLASGRCYWNSGIFVWRAATLIDQLRARQPAMVGHLETIAAAAETPEFESVFQQEFARIQGRSIDYAVMEQAAAVTVIEAPFTWDDVGSWQAIARLHAADSDGNVLTGRHLSLQTRTSIVRTTEDHLVVTIGLEDCIVVHTPDATLVVRRDQEEKVREVVKQLEQRGWSEYL